MMFLTMALRNLRKNARRSLATLIAITVGFLAINLFASFLGNIYKDIGNKAVYGEGIGHLTLTKRGFLKEGTLHPDRYLFGRQEQEALTAFLLKETGVDFVSPSLSASGLLSNGKVSTIFLAEGEPPGTFNRFLQAGIAGIERPALDSGKPGAGIVSKGLAEMLGAKPGESLVAFSMTMAGQTNALDLGLLDIWDTHQAETNDKTLRVPLDYLQKLLDTDGVSRLVVMFREKPDVDKVRAELLPRLKQAGFDVEIQTWVERSVFYQQVRSMMDMMFTFLTLIVVVVVLMSILNTLSTSVMERVREIGTLRALGLERGGIIRLFAIEGWLLGVMGSVLGAILTLVVVMGVNGAHLTWLPPDTTSPVPFRLAVLPGTILGCLVFLTLVAALAAFWPARRAARVEIVDALGHV